MFGDKNS